MNVRDVEVPPSIAEKVHEYVIAHRINIVGHYGRNGMLFVRLAFPAGSYAPFHREFLLWDVKLT